MNLLYKLLVTFFENKRFYLGYHKSFIFYKQSLCKEEKVNDVTFKRKITDSNAEDNKKLTSIGN